MKKLLLVLLFVPTLVLAGELPDSSLTPGAIDPRPTLMNICTSGYTAGYWYQGQWFPKGQHPKRAKPVRSVSKNQKLFVFDRYGMDENERNNCSEGYEIDHLISLQLGGSNDILNLWPHSYCRLKDSQGKEIIPSSAKDKDLLENTLKTLVCSGLLPLEEAQKAISENWIEAYKKYVLNQ